MTILSSRTFWALLGLAVLMLAVQEFSWHAMWRGMAGLRGDAEAQGRLAGSLPSTTGMFLHMVTGGLVTRFAVIQLAAPIRTRWPHIHRLSGRILVPLALITAIGGLTYIALRGTIGGPMMSVGFGLYGVLMALAAVQTLRFALARERVRHRRWGLRLIVLALGSWIYRVHYGLLYGITCSLGEELCGLGSQSDFLGPFDIIQNLAFYAPYLLILEWYLRRGSQTSARMS